MSSPAPATEAQLKSEIARLTASINQHKASQQSKKIAHSGYETTNAYYSPYPSGPSKRSNTYVNPGYKANKYVRPGFNVASSSKSTSQTTTPSTSIGTTPGPSSKRSSVIPSFTKPASSNGDEKKEVVLGGVAFELSARSLVRKDLPKSSNPVSITKVKSTSTAKLHPYIRKPGHVPPGRSYKMKVRRGRNMTLNNTRSYQSSRRLNNKRVNKYVDKPCPRFTTTGAVYFFLHPLLETGSTATILALGRGTLLFAIYNIHILWPTILGTCSRGLTCMYQHDPSKIAICWPFLQGNCPNTTETCNLSHDPTPERTPLCVHFLNKGRCTRENCPYPHVNVGKREGVCRDFAVLGYCERGLDCDHQHVRECPDFAEKGTCGTKGCKLPHVIRANQKRKAAAVAAANTSDKGSTSIAPGSTDLDEMDTMDDGAKDAPMLTADDGQLGDEFISLTFKESESEDEDESGSEEGEESDENEDDGSEESESDIDLEVNM